MLLFLAGTITIVHIVRWHIWEHKVIYAESKLSHNMPGWSKSLGAAVWVSESQRMSVVRNHDCKLVWVSGLLCYIFIRVRTVTTALPATSVLPLTVAPLMPATSSLDQTHITDNQTHRRSVRNSRSKYAHNGFTNNLIVTRLEWYGSRLSWIVNLQLCREHTNFVCDHLTVPLLIKLVAGCVTPCRGQGFRSHGPCPLSINITSIFLVSPCGLPKQLLVF